MAENDELLDKLELQRHDIRRYGMTAVKDSSGLAAGTLRSFAKGARPERSVSINKVLAYEGIPGHAQAAGLSSDGAGAAENEPEPQDEDDWDCGGFLESEPDEEGAEVEDREDAEPEAPAEPEPAASRADGGEGAAPREAAALRAPIGAAIGYDAKTGRSAFGVSLAAFEIGCGKMELARLLEAGEGFEDERLRESAEAFIRRRSQDAGPLADCSIFRLDWRQGWALEEDAVTDAAFDAYCELRARGLSARAFDWVPGGERAAVAWMEGEPMPYETVRGAKLALGLATPFERGCARLPEFAERRARYALPAPSPDAPLDCAPTLRGTLRNAIISELSRMGGATRRNVGQLAAAMGLPESDEGCEGLGDAEELEWLVRGEGKPSWPLEDAVREYFGMPG